MYISFNDLTMDNKFPCDETIDAKERFCEFLKLVRSLTTEGIMEGLLLSEEALLSKIIEDYSINDWLNDPSVKYKYKQYFRSFLGKYCSRLKASEFCSEYKIEYEGTSYKCVGGLFSIEHDIPLLSVLTNQFWHQERILGEYSVLNDKGNLLLEDRQIENWTECILISELKEAIAERQYKYISSGDDLWEQREVLFPNLVFCENVKAQLHSDPERFHVLRIIEKLKCLQKYFSELEGAYSIKDIGMNARTESESVKKDPNLNKFRLFKLPNGEQEYFFDHIGFTGKYDQGRIYFFPLIEEKKCYIGYIGRHLPTSKY